MSFRALQHDTEDLEAFLVGKSRTGNRDDVFVLLTHLLAECGEVADEIKGLEGKRAEDPSNYSREELAKELVDVTFNTLRVANKYGIDLDEFWSMRLKKIRAKFN